MFWDPLLRDLGSESDKHVCNNRCENCYRKKQVLRGHGCEMTQRAGSQEGDMGGGKPPSWGVGGSEERKKKRKEERKKERKEERTT